MAQADGVSPEYPQPTGPLPVLRPLLPTADRLVPYLRRIDESRIYSNWGPLASELELRLCPALDVPEGSVVSASSGTAALAGAILAVAGRASVDRPVALLPAFTFVATAVAAEQCGYEVFLADVDPSTWMLDPVRVAQEVDLARVGVVVPVAPFGRPVPQEPWLAFTDATGIPVAIDAAASFELAVGAEYLGRIPVAMSFHATKSFSSGEGGCVITTDAPLAEAALRALNFGFSGTRDAKSASINGKLSEYHAAVGLAELDGWDAKRLELARVAGVYRSSFVGAGIDDRLVAAPDVASCYVLLHLRDADEGQGVKDALTSAGFDHRAWYGGGLQHETYFQGLPREHLPITESLAPAILGLPVAPDLDREQILAITRTVLGVAGA